jgi:FkbM family methyltransferase
MTVTSYAQFLEDVTLYRALAGVQNGFYIDVGAYRPEEHSVTKLFYDLGWSGINIEPCQVWFDELIKKRTRDINIHAAVSSAAGYVEIHGVAGSGLSTSIAPYADNYRSKGYEVKTFTVEARTLADICLQYVTSEIHFLKIDVEGSEREVLLGANFDKYRPWFVMMEATIPETETPCHTDWEHLLIDAGYSFAMAHRINRLYVANERMHLKSALVVPIDDYKLAGPDSEILSLRGEILSLRNELVAFKSELKRVNVRAEMDHRAHTSAIAQIHDSLSWKLTAPLRKLRSILTS